MFKMNNKIVALCYDFDKTLTTDDMQAYGLIPKLGFEKPVDCWKKRMKFSEATGCESSLSLLRLFMDECASKNISLTRKFLNDMGKNIEFYKGVDTWFDRINKYAKSKGVKLEHYVISAGNYEIMEGCPIFKYFKNVFACEYLYDKNGIAYWPKNIVNYTLKTQYLFRISKGVMNLVDDQEVNKKTAHKRIDFCNMVYLGDGNTDIPCMTLVKSNGGTSISVYDIENKAIALKLKSDDRVNYACPSDYSEGSQIDKVVKLVIDKCSL